MLLMQDCEKNTYIKILYTMDIIIVAPSLDSSQNVSGVSAVTTFIINNNKLQQYIHFQQGRQDSEGKGFSRYLRVLKNYREWKKVLNKYPEALIHYNYPLDTPSIVRDFFFIRYAYRHKREMVIHLHGGLYLFKEDKPWIIDEILKTVFNYDVPLIVLSDKEMNHISKIYHRAHVFSLPNCIDTSMAVAFQREENNDKLRLLYLGRIEKNKGIDYILDALKVLDNQGIDFIFRMAGKENVEGDYIGRFKEALKDKFEYRGVVSGKCKDDLLKDSDVFVMPSFYEGLPMALLECMSFGVVPVVTDVGSIGEYVKDGENGKIVMIKDTETIVNAISSIDEDRKLLAKLSGNARNTIFTRLDPKEYVKSLNMIYQNV